MLEVAVESSCSPSAAWAVILVKELTCSQGASVHPQCPRQDSGDHSATLMAVTIFTGRCSPQVLRLKEAEGEAIPSVGSAASRAARPPRCRL